MRSQLSRVVLRRILLNQPFVCRSCLSRTAKAAAATSYHHDGPLALGSQARSLFNLAGRKQRKIKDANFAPGFETMLELNKTSQMGVRPPDSARLAEAFNHLVRTKLKSHEPLQDLQAIQLGRTFVHLDEQPPPEGKPWLSLEDLRRTMRALAFRTDGPTEPHKQLARFLLKEIESRIRADPSLKPPDPAEDVAKLVCVLAQMGSATEAEDVARKKLWTPERIAQGLHTNTWLEILKGYASEGNKEGVLRMMAMGQQKDNGVETAWNLLIRFYADRNDLDQVKHYYEKRPYGNDLEKLEAATFEAILQCCLRNNALEWGNSVIRDIGQKELPKHVWDTIFVWAAATGSGIDDIDRLITAMVENGAKTVPSSAPKLHPDNDTINRLIEFAVSEKDSYLAERYMDLGRKWDVRPNAKTYILQMDYRLSVNDVKGALEAYRKLQGEEVVDNEDVPIVNRLIRAMCGYKRRDYDEIMSVVTDLNERKARFEPETVAALSLLHLGRDEIYDVIDLLQTHVFHYSREQRESVYNVLVEFCLNRNNGVASVWDAYTILHHIFNEIDRDIRTSIMREFYARNRPDMAFHVFNHMRKHTVEPSRANEGTYVVCLEGIADTQDSESLEAVHNLLKLDLQIEPSTRLNNALMLAHTACELTQRSLDIWESIVQSREGPTYSSIQLALQACETTPAGYETAQEIWAMLKKMQIDITPELFAAYVGAIAGNGLLHDAEDLIAMAEKETGRKPDAFL